MNDNKLVNDLSNLFEEEPEHVRGDKPLHWRRPWWSASEHHVDEDQQECTVGDLSQREDQVINYLIT